MTPTIWPLAHGRHLELGARAVVMGVLNVTPDSFSDGGSFVEPRDAVARARQMVAEGAAIIDVGGESTRPGAAAVTQEEELRRVIPVIEALADWGGALISIDTYRADIARQAVNAGAHIVNDIWGLQADPEMASAVAASGAGVVVMHNGRDRVVLPDPIEDQIAWLERSLSRAGNAGIAEDKVVLDPGFGFAKETVAINLELVDRLPELAVLGRPLLVGTSRKRFVGAITGREPAERAAGTAATNVILRMQGAALFRVHDVAINVDALAVADAMLAHRNRV